MALGTALKRHGAGVMKRFSFLGEMKLALELLDRVKDGGDRRASMCVWFRRRQ